MSFSTENKQYINQIGEILRRQGQIPYVKIEGEANLFRALSNDAEPLNHGERVRVTGTYLSTDLKVARI